MTTRLPAHLKVRKSASRSRKLKRARLNLTGGTQVPQTVQSVVDKAIINEKKRNAHYVDLGNANYSCDSTGGTITLIATCGQGAAQTQRVGKKGLWKSIQLHGSVYNNASAVYNDVAILIVYDREPLGILPGITDILTAVDSRAFNNDSNSERFKIIRRYDIALTGSAANQVGARSHVDMDHYIDMRNLPVTWGNLGSGALGDIKQGALYLVTVGNNAVGATAATATLAFRTRFIDLA